MKKTLEIILCSFALISIVIGIITAVKRRNNK